MEKSHMIAFPPTESCIHPKEATLGRQYNKYFIMLKDNKFGSRIFSFVLVPQGSNSLQGSTTSSENHLSSGPN